MKQKLFSELTALSSANVESNVAILAIGDVSAWRLQGGLVKGTGQVAFYEFNDVTSTLLELARPPMIVSPLLTRQFDCIDLAERLSDLGYAGAYRAIAITLPAPEIVRREIRLICPNLDFDVVAWPTDPFTAVN
jgi:hypothetical protein